MCMSLMILVAKTMLLGKSMHLGINKICPLIHEGRRDLRIEILPKGGSHLKPQICDQGQQTEKVP